MVLVRAVTNRGRTALPAKWRYGRPGFKEFEKFRGYESCTGMGIGDDGTYERAASVAEVARLGALALASVLGIGAVGPSYSGWSAGAVAGRRPDGIGQSVEHGGGLFVADRQWREEPYDTGVTAAKFDDQAPSQALPLDGGG